ncbi:hypothetical protein BC940DRAFT_6347 [Gongronella butleri]|nr:hypothetical protein BC940DRAFT_6347 [Gongronella butleri]
MSPSHDDCADKTPCDEHEQAQDINETTKPDLENEKGSIETEKNATNEPLAPSSSFIVADVPLTTTAVPVSAAIMAPAACETPEFVAEPQLVCIESHDAAKASKDVHPQPPTPDHADPTPKPSSIDTNTTNTTNSVSLSPEHSPQPPHDITPPASETEQSAKPVKKPPPKSDKRISAAKTAPVKATTPAVPESAVKKPSKDALKENTRGTASGAGTTRIATRATPKKRDDVKTPPPQRPPPRVAGPRATLTAKERPRSPATPAKDSPAAAAAAATIRQGSPVPAPKRSSTRTSLIARLTQPTQSSARKQHNATPATATPPTTTTTTNTTKQASYTTTLKLERRRKHFSSDAPSPPPATRATTRQVEKRLSLDPAQLTAGARKTNCRSKRMSQKKPRKSRRLRHPKTMARTRPLKSKTRL